MDASIIQIGTQIKGTSFFGDVIVTDIFVSPSSGKTVYQVNVEENGAYLANLDDLQEAF